MIETQALPSPLQTVDRALQVLDLFGPGRPDLSVSEVAQSIEIDRSIASRLLAALEARHYLVQEPGSGRFRLGIRLLELGALYLQHDRLVAVSVPHLQTLAAETGGVANVFVLRGREAVRLTSYPDRPITGIKVPAHCTAAGKVLLAALSETELADVLSGPPLAACTPRSITDAEALRECLARVREQGFASELEERNLGRGCLAAPVRDVTGRTVAAMSFSTLASQLTPERMPSLVDAVREAALHVSDGLGIVSL